MLQIISKIKSHNCFSVNCLCFNKIIHHHQETLRQNWASLNQNLWPSLFLVCLFSLSLTSFRTLACRSCSRVTVQVSPLVNNLDETNCLRSCLLLIYGAQQIFNVACYDTQLLLLHLIVFLSFVFFSERSADSQQLTAARVAAGRPQIISNLSTVKHKEIQMINSCRNIRAVLNLDVCNVQF